MKKALIVVILLLAVFVGEMLLFDNNTHAQDTKPFIAVTNFPLYEISTKLLNKKIEVKKLIPFGVETHTYTPSVKTMTQITKAELLLFSGLGMEPWITKAHENGVDMSQFVQLKALDEKGHEGHHHDVANDPHYWLDIENMIRITSILSEKFLRHFPQYKDSIETNSKNYINDLRGLKKAYEKGLKTCKKREIVVNHDAFSYLGHKYNFHSHTLTGLSPDEQVSAKKMNEIATLVKEEDLKIVFFESFVSSKVIQTISHETGVRVESLQPLANVTQEEAKQGYIAIMKENLGKLSTAMECE